MSFKNKNLSVLAYANGFTCWHYKAEADEKLKDIESDTKYFGAVSCLMNPGDIIIINADETGIRCIDTITENNFVKLGVLK